MADIMQDQLMNSKMILILKSIWLSRKTIKLAYNIYKMMTTFTRSIDSFVFLKSNLFLLLLVCSLDEAIMAVQDMGERSLLVIRWRSPLISHLRKALVRRIDPKGAGELTSQLAVVDILWLQLNGNLMIMNNNKLFICETTQCLSMDLVLPLCNRKSYINTLATYFCIGNDSLSLF